MAEGIERRVTKKGTAYVARVYDAPSGRRVSRSFPTMADARRWRTHKTTEAARGVSLIGTPVTLREASERFLAGIASGAIRSKRGTPYKPSAIRGYSQALNLHLLPTLAGAKLARIAKKDVQRIVDDMLAAGAKPSTIRNAVKPLQAIYRLAIDDGDLAVNPCERLRLPAVESKRDRIADPQEAARLLALLAKDRALWAMAFYAGLRMGELRALDWRHVDLAGGVIRVERSMDATGELIEPKSKAGRRFVPIIEPLRCELVMHRLASGREDGYVFGTTATRPFAWGVVTRRATTAWGTAEKLRAEKTPKAPRIEPIGLHECRHTYASFLIAAGVNAKAVSTYMGHGSVAVTFDIYGHLFPGAEAEAGEMLERFLSRADSTGRIAQVAEPVPVAEKWH